MATPRKTKQDPRQATLDALLEIRADDSIGVGTRAAATRSARALAAEMGIEDPVPPKTKMPKMPATPENLALLVSEREVATTSGAKAVMTRRITAMRDELGLEPETRNTAASALSALLASKLA